MLIYLKLALNRSKIYKVNKVFIFAPIKNYKTNGNCAISVNHLLAAKVP